MSSGTARPGLNGHDVPVSASLPTAELTSEGGSLALSKTSGFIFRSMPLPVYIYYKTTTSLCHDQSTSPNLPKAHRALYRYYITDLALCLIFLTQGKTEREQYTDQHFEGKKKKRFSTTCFCSTFSLVTCVYNLAKKKKKPFLVTCKSWL